MTHTVLAGTTLPVYTTTTAASSALAGLPPINGTPYSRQPVLEEGE
jgi:hypothetical protein